ncbi:DUF58 domain-containing protein [Aurantibacter sp.]|uniref:DUF58 domain-containing protein n=1 Tax=Aurantibacter sp. TaxID=2807103 RepID=UPI0035C831EE
MVIRDEVNKVGGFKNLDFLAKQVVEGFISGKHKSPFHGFSAEFAEHKIYNPGESTRHIDWKLFAKTDKLYTKRYDDETNLRCHIVIDNSSSMHYPELKTQSIANLNKIGFSALASASLMHMFKKQRDAVGLSVYSNTYDFYAQEKGSERHYNILLNQLDDLLVNTPEKQQTDTYKYLHLIAEKIHRRSLIFVFTDLFQTTSTAEELFEALRHLKYNKHEVILFHVTDKAKEMDFDFMNTPKRYFDVETGEEIDLYADQIKETYQETVKKYFNDFRLKCGQNNIKYILADVNQNFDSILSTYLVERQKMK